MMIRKLFFMVYLYIQIIIINKIFQPSFIILAIIYGYIMLGFQNPIDWKKFGF
jgi:hypothetical protein